MFIHKNIESLRGIREKKIDGINEWQEVGKQLDKRWLFIDKPRGQQLTTHQVGMPMVVPSWFVYR